MTSNTVYLLLADAVLFSHILFVAFVVFGLISIVAGGIWQWRWVRNPWVRIIHLCGIIIVALQAWAGLVCPLTTLEMWLRHKGGEQTYSGSFISYWMNKLLYYDWPAWVFILLYTACACLIVATWIWVRPRPFTQRHDDQRSAQYKE